MNNKLLTIIDILKTRNQTISTMESCTGGGLVNNITNIAGVSDIIKFSAVTYSNEYKIKMGVSADIIDKYTVYSRETANEMSHKISLFTNSDYGIGITGMLNRVDKNNKVDQTNLVYISIYDKCNNKFYNCQIEVNSIDRETNKQQVIDKALTMLEEVISN